MMENSSLRLYGVSLIKPSERMMSKGRKQPFLTTAFLLEDTENYRKTMETMKRKKGQSK
jgi:hypothetical protein